MASIHSVSFRDDYLRYLPSNINIKNNPYPDNNSIHKRNNKKTYMRRKKSIKDTINNNNISNNNKKNNNNKDNKNNINNNINGTKLLSKPTILRNKEKYRSLKKKRKVSINGLHHYHHNQAPYYYYQNRHPNNNNNSGMDENKIQIPNQFRLHTFNSINYDKYYNKNDKNRNGKDMTKTTNFNNNGNNNNDFLMAPKFDKNIIDTFCFHWPEKHRYLLVKVLPTSIAILPVRGSGSRLAFLYFCYAPRPRQPSFFSDSIDKQQQQQQQQQSKRLRVFQSWKHTLTFHDSSSSSTDSYTSSDELDDFKKLKKEQYLKEPSSTSTTPLSSIKINNNHSIKNINDINNNNYNNNTMIEDNVNNHPLNNNSLINNTTHSNDFKENIPISLTKSMNNNHQKQQHQDNNNDDMGIIIKSKSVNHHHHPITKSKEKNNIEINIHDSDDNIVSLSDVLNHQLNTNSYWLHAPCQLIEEKEDDKNEIEEDNNDNEGNNNHSNNNENKFIILQSENTTLKLKARCVSEKNMFINLFKLNQVTYNSSPTSNTSFISGNDLLETWRIKNQELLDKVNDIALKLEKHKVEVEFYNQKCEELEELLDDKWDALKHYKDNHLSDSDRKSIMTTSHKRLVYYGEQFKSVQNRLDKIGKSSSSWILDNAFRHYERFKESHLMSHIYYHLEIFAVIGILIVVIAVVIGYHYHY